MLLSPVGDGPSGGCGSDCIASSNKGKLNRADLAELLYYVDESERQAIRKTLSIIEAEGIGKWTWTPLITVEDREEIKGGFVPSFRFLYPRSGVWYRRSVFCTLIPFFGTR